MNEWLGLLLSTEQELINESEKHKIHVPTLSKAIVNDYVFFVELAVPAIISTFGQFSRIYCVSKWLALIL